MVAEVLHTAASELLAVKRDSGELLVPFVAAIVTSVSLDDGIVEIDPPEGCWIWGNVRIDVITIFPASWIRCGNRCRARRSSRVWSTCGCTTCGGGPTTCTTRWTTRPTAAVREW